MKHPGQRILMYVLHRTDFYNTYMNISWHQNSFARFCMAIIADCINPEAPLTPKKHPFASNFLENSL